MDATLTTGFPMTAQDRDISAAIARDTARLRNFIRRRVADPADAEDILQDVFYEFVQAYRLMKPIEQAGAWLFRVARNRIIDFYRKRRTDPLRESPAFAQNEGSLTLQDLLPSADSGPEAKFLRSL